MNRMECERSGNGMLVKLAKLCLISKRTLQTVCCAKTGSLPYFVFGKLYKKCNPRDFKYYLDKVNHKTINFVFAFNNAFYNKKDNLTLLHIREKFH